MPRDPETLKIRPWASAGDRIDPDDASLSPALSRSVGWPASFSADGGDTPRRQVFNQVLHEITTALHYLHRRGIAEWHAMQDYEANALVQSGGLIWRASVATGPATSNATDPGTSGQTLWVQYGGEQTRPGAITSTTAVRGNGQVVLSWACPLDGGQLITSYTVQWRLTTEAFSTSRQVTVNSLMTTYTVTGLTNGSTYSFRVRATNSIGTGDWSAERSQTPLPMAPGAIVASVTAGDGYVDVSWNTPENNGAAITSYVIQWKSGSESYSSSRQNFDLASPFRVNNLTNGTEYDFRVSAINNRGAGPWSSEVSATPSANVPGQVPTLGVTPGDAQVRFTWGSASDGGSPLLRYRVQWRSDQETYSDLTRVQVHSIDNRMRLVTSLENGRLHFFRVRAENAVGEGEWGEVSTTPVVLDTVPQAITSLSATAGQGSVGLTWSVPQDGGNPLTGYRIQWRTSAQTFSDSRSSITQGTGFIVGGLENGTQYFFRVAGVNSDGVGEYSSEVSATPMTTVPGVIPRLELENRENGVNLAWTVQNDGGSPITRFDIRFDTSQTFSSFQTFSLGDASVRSYLVPEGQITEGNTYYFQIRALNANGTGDWSAASSIVFDTGLDVPDAPLTAPSGEGRSSQIVWTWNPPGDGGSPITSYEFQHRRSGASTWTTVTTSTATYTATGLDESVSYDGRFRAINARGNSGYSPTGVVATVPDSMEWTTPGTYTFTWPWETSRGRISAEGGGGGGGGGGSGGELLTGTSVAGGAGGAGASGASGAVRTAVVEGVAREQVFTITVGSGGQMGAGGSIPSNQEDGAGGAGGAGGSRGGNGGSGGRFGQDGEGNGGAGGIPGSLTVGITGIGGGGGGGGGGAGGGQGGDGGDALGGWPGGGGGGSGFAGSESRVTTSGFTLSAPGGLPGGGGGGGGGAGTSESFPGADASALGSSGTGGAGGIGGLYIPGSLTHRRASPGSPGTAGTAGSITILPLY